MKKYIFFVASIVVAGFSFAGSNHWPAGKVDNIVVFESSYPVFAKFYLEGVSAVGDCAVTKGYVIFAIARDGSEQAMYSMLLTAYGTGKPVRVFVNTSQKEGEVCIAKNIRVNPNS